MANADLFMSSQWIASILPIYALIPQPSNYGLLPDIAWGPIVEFSSDSMQSGNLYRHVATK
jgi:hypothetical protein